MRGVLLLLTAAACGHSAAAPPRPAAPATGGIAGTVRDHATGDPLSFVTVIARGPAAGAESTATDGGGAFLLGELPPGRYQVIARWGERTVVVDDVPVGAGGVATLALRLSLAPDAPPAEATTYAVLHARRPETPPVATDQQTVGGIRGQVRDKVTSDFLPGAVVAATTPGARDAVLSMADDDGRFRMPALAPGVYTLSAYYNVIDRGAIEVRRTNVRVDAGKITVIDLDLDAQPRP